MNTEIKIDYDLAAEPFTYDEALGHNMFDMSKTALGQEMAQLEEARIEKEEIEKDIAEFTSTYTQYELDEVFSIAFMQYIEKSENPNEINSAVLKDIFNLYVDSLKDNQKPAPDDFITYIYNLNDEDTAEIYEEAEY